MALYKVSWRKSWDTANIARRKWSTTIYIEAASSVAAAAAGVGMWVSFLRQACRNTVFCYEVYATDLVPGTSDYTVQGVPAGSQRGTLALTGLGEPYLPKACISVTIPVTGSRPSRKFWRPGLFEADVVNGEGLLTTIGDVVKAQWDAALAAASSLRDPDNELLTANVTVRLTTREFGRESTNLPPEPPPVG